MIFLPIVERELRVAARKRSSFWLRIVAALVALIIGSGFLALTMVGSFGFGLASLGHGLFAVLTWLSFAAALSAGLFFTSDCLSEEKREGTLGFLFLTDLRGYDVVLGKLLATSLRSFYALLAVFPILAVTLLMGGVTGGQFWMTLLALVNALFMSLAAGMFVSAISRDSQKTLAATVFLLCLVVVAGPMFDRTFAVVRARGFTPVLSLTSPGYLFGLAGSWGQSPFWLALLGNQVVAWLLFGLASLLLPRTWQERANKVSKDRTNWMYAWKFGGAKSRRTFRRKLIEPNPVLWLACRERWQSWVLWLLAILMAGGFVATFANKYGAILGMAWSYFGGLLIFGLYLGIASHASRFLVEARRSGMIELLLAAPLTSKQIVRGQWCALLRMFGAPLTLLMGTQLLGTFLAQQMTWNQIATMAPATRTVMTTTNTMIMTTNYVSVTTVTPGGPGPTVSVGGFAGPNEIVILVISAAGTLTVVANLTALSWFGMWMGLNSRNNNLATLKTIVFVQVIPWFVIAFASMLIVPLLLLPTLMKGIPPAMPQIMTWYPLLTTAVATLLYLVKDVAFTLWARRRLYSKFREQSVQFVSPILPPPPPALPRADLPPVIAPT